MNVTLYKVPNHTKLRLMILILVFGSLGFLFVVI